MSDPRFLQDGFDKQLSHVIEECGEVLSAAGKLQRWGSYSVNPLLPPEQQEMNIDWLKREMLDLTNAIGRLQATIQAAPESVRGNAVVECLTDESGVEWHVSFYVGKIKLRSHSLGNEQEAEALQATLNALTLN